MRIELEGLILNYRLGRKTQYPRECLIKILEVDPSDYDRLNGWKVSWPADDPKIFGKIIGLHGKKGVLRARFKRGVPGQALNSRVKVTEPG